MPTFTDQLGRNVVVPANPRRIVSLVPSQTELLAYLGLHEEVVGITRFCVRPPDWFRTKTRVGGTKQLKPEVIDALAPDLILANKEENTREEIEALARRYPVWVSDVPDLPAALAMISAVGRLTGRSAPARQLAEAIHERFDGLATEWVINNASRPRAAYFIWRNPLMVAGGGTFINDMLTRAGFENAFADRERYPEVSPADLQAAQPFILLLSSEPYPFRKKHFAELAGICPQAVIRLVDGESFSWYGSRLLEAPAYFRTLRAGLPDTLKRV